MKYLYLAFVAAVLTGCQNRYAEINGTVKGFTSGNFVIKDAAGHIKYSGNIEDGKFHLKRMMDTIGFYQLKLVQDGFKDIRRPDYIIYLEPGTYNISAASDSVFQYPNIQSSSTTQTELSQYYAIANAKTADVAPQIEKYEDDVYGSNSTNGSEDEKSKLWQALAARDKKMTAALQEYVTKYPNNHVEAYLMYQMDYGSDPDTYNAIFQKFTDEQKKSDEGVEESTKLTSLEGLAPGKPAPQLFGSMPDGKAFDPKSLNKKVVLLEFWLAGDETAKDIHSKLQGDGFSPLKTNAGNFGVVSVSMDSDPAAWKKAISEGGLKWPQIADMKGNGSPNITNWQIARSPTYFLVDGKTWTIIKRDESYETLAGDVDDYVHTGKVK